MISVKMKNILANLSQNYMPFKMLSQERLSEMLNLVRLIEMQKEEIFQIRGGKGHDYLFVMEGRIEVIQTSSIKSAGAEDTSKRPVLLPPEPLSSTILAKENSIICHADRETLDNLISWDGIVNFMGEEDDELYSRLDLVRNSLVFRRLPLEAVEMAFKCMREVEVKKGEEIVRQGELGDAYYIITAGQAEVFRRGLYDDTPEKVVDLKVGDTFGSEALISGKMRDETVRMTSDGSLLVLQSQDFQELIKKPLIKYVNSKVARTMLETDYELLDVRYMEEYEEMSIPGAIHIPLHELRDRTDELNKEDKYVIYCHTDNRSAVAALFLAEHKFDVMCLEGGIRDWPFETESKVYG